MDRFCYTFKRAHRYYLIDKSGLGDSRILRAGLLIFPGESAGAERVQVSESFLLLESWVPGPLGSLIMYYP